jgi:hypothetical protein
MALQDGFWLVWSKTVWWAIILANVSDDAVTLVEGACFQFMETMKAKVVNRRSVERGA